jgi:hypothetical protein
MGAVAASWAHIVVEVAMTPPTTLAIHIARTFITCTFNLPVRKFAYTQRLVRSGGNPRRAIAAWFR